MAFSPLPGAGPTSIGVKAASHQRDAERHAVDTSHAPQANTQPKHIWVSA